jgi:hypothetical protein
MALRVIEGGSECRTDVGVIVDADGFDCIINSMNFSQIGLLEVNSIEGAGNNWCPQLRELLLLLLSLTSKSIIAFNLHICFEFQRRAVVMQRNWIFSLWSLNHMRKRNSRHCHFFSEYRNIPNPNIKNAKYGDFFNYCYYIISRSVGLIEGGREGAFALEFFAGRSQC